MAEAQESAYRKNATKNAKDHLSASLPTHPSSRTPPSLSQPGRKNSNWCKCGKCVLHKKNKQKKNKAAESRTLTHDHLLAANGC